MTTRQEGSAAFMVAVALLLLVAFASLAIDGSLGYDERRDLQNSADNAAYAAAYEYCNPRDSASTEQQAAEQVAAQNGFDATDPDVTVTATGTGGEWTVMIQVDNVENRFGGATPLANDEFTVVASGTARCVYEPFAGGYAIFANSQVCPGNELTINASDITIDGDLHTNQNGNVTGSNITMTGDATYTESMNDPHDDLSATQEAAKDLPLDPAIIDWYRPSPPLASLPSETRTDDSKYHGFTGDIDNDVLIASLPSIATGDSTNITFKDDVIIYTDGTVDLKGVDSGGFGITIVAEGEISLIASTNIDGYDQIKPGVPGTELVLFSFWKEQDPPPCPPGQASAVKVSANGITWSGLIFAPNGQVQFSASSGTTFGGSIIANLVNLSGSNYTIAYDDSANADPTYELDLVR